MDPEPQQEPMTAEEENRIFRELLFAAHGFGYADDGEMQSTNKFPFIDFKRDSAAEIRAKITERNLRAMNLGSGT
jgi:hypothetical protein